LRLRSWCYFDTVGVLQYRSNPATVVTGTDNSSSLGELKPGEHISDVSSGINTDSLITARMADTAFRGRSGGSERTKRKNPDEIRMTWLQQDRRSGPRLEINGRHSIE